MTHHACFKNGWQQCVACEGRIHLNGCTSQMRKDRDCCPARHKMLHEQGQTEGILDSALKMWDPNTVYKTLRQWGK